MQITCPCCFARFAIEASLNDEHARRAVAIAAKMPAPIADLALSYIGLFRPAKRALDWKRAASLLDELVGSIQSGQVVRHGRTWPAPLESWRDALEEMLTRREKLQLPLKSHGYLFEIVSGNANKAEAKQENKTEDTRRRTGNTEARQSGPTKVSDIALRALDQVKKTLPKGDA